MTRNLDLSNIADEPGEKALSAKDIVVDYRSARGGHLRAVDHVSVDIHAGEVLGLVGESGCGKSSFGRSLVHLPPPTSGTVEVQGVPLDRLSPRDLRRQRRRLQLIFQDPISSLNPRRTATSIVAEPLRISGADDPVGQARAMLAEVGVSGALMGRRPHELSGGQCQRVSIARAMVQEPSILICDEPVSALDVSVQAQVLNLLQRMKIEHSLSVLFISHDLAVVNHVSDRVAVMYLGRLCEVGRAEDLYRAPRHHYTRLLLTSVPQPGVERRRSVDVPATGGPPRPDDRDIMRGCAFADRCPGADQQCRDEMPDLIELAPGHVTACHHPLASTNAPPGASSVGVR